MLLLSLSSVVQLSFIYLFILPRIRGNLLQSSKHQRTLTRDKRNGFAQICSLQIRCKHVNTEEQIYGKHGKCHVCLVIFGMQLWHLPSLPYILILLSIYIFARSKFVHIHFFRPVATTGREIRKRRQNIVWYKAWKKFPPNFTSLPLTGLFVRGQNRIDPSSSSTIPKRIGIFEFAKL